MWQKPERATITWWNECLFPWVWCSCGVIPVDLLHFITPGRFFFPLLLLLLLLPLPYGFVVFIHVLAFLFLFFVSFYYFLRSTFSRHIFRLPGISFVPSFIILLLPFPFLYAFVFFTRILTFQFLLLLFSLSFSSYFYSLTLRLSILLWLQRSYLQLIWLIVISLDAQISD